MDGRNDVAQSSVGLMVVEGNTSWERMFGSAIMAVMSSSFYRWRKESSISILLLLTPRQYCCSVSVSFRLNMDSSIGTKVSG